MPLTTAEANSLLPQAATQEAINPLKLNYLLIGPPKFGKTTFFCDIPDAILLAFEQGHAFQKAHKMVIDAWDKKVTEENPAIWEEMDENGKPNGIYHGTMTKVVEVLEASDRFQFVIIDTADMCAKMCLDYFLAKHNWSHAKDGGDFGVGHDIAQNTPFRKMVGRLLRTGRGVGFISHSEVKKTDLGSKKETTLPNGVFKFLHTQADIILHGEFGVQQKKKTYRDRRIRTEGDENTLAGNRVKGLRIPQRYIVDPENPWGQWAAFFTDESAVQSAEEEVAIADSQAVRENSTAEGPEEPAAAPVEPEQQEPVKRKARKGK